MVTTITDYSLVVLQLGKTKQNYRIKSTKAIKNDEDALARFLLCLVQIFLSELVHLCKMTYKLFLFGYISELALTFT